MSIEANGLVEHSHLNARIASWTSYWSSGVLHSCTGSFAGNYDGEIAEFWQAAFSGLTDRERVLDIATGNGPLPRMLLGLDGCVDRGCRVDAIDLAQLAPQWLDGLEPAKRSRLALHSGVMAEHLPFDSASFDLVVSQYGIEYADPDRAMAEAARVLKPGGRVRLVMHHDQSVVVRMGRVETRQFESIIDASGLVEMAQRLLPWLALASTAAGRSRLQVDAQANADRDAYNRVQKQLQSHIDEAGEFGDLLVLVRDQVQATLAMVSAQGLDAAQAALAHLSRLYQAHLIRVRELCAHAFDPERMGGLLRQLDALGFASATARPLHHQSRLMGWAVCAERS